MRLSDVRSDFELIQAINQGETAGFSELLSRYSGKAYNLALRLTRCPEDAEEVLQDVFATVYRKLRGFEGKSSFSSWFYRVTVNAALMRIRKRKQEKALPLEDAFPEQEALENICDENTEAADVVVLRRELRSALDAAISRLDEEYRPVFILRDVNGMSAEEVSTILKLSVPAVKSRLHRSRLMLRKKLAAVYAEYSSGKAAAYKQVGNL